jgi:flagellar hook assembly protein FlgD
VTVSGGYVYLAGSISGLHILPVQCDPMSGVWDHNRLEATMTVRVIPNPISHATVLRFQTRSKGTAQAAVYDARGRLVCALFEGTLPAGSHDVQWSGLNAKGDVVAAGVYFLRISTVEGSSTVRCIKIR